METWIDTKPLEAEARCPSCRAALTSEAHVHYCLHDRLDAARYAELFWEEA